MYKQFAPFFMNLPTCAVCEKPVDKLKMHESNFNGSVAYEVSCHGKREYFQLRDVDIVGASKIEMGKAFQKEADSRLPPPQKQIGSGESS